MWTISTIYDFIVGTLSRLLLAENFDIKGDFSLVTFSGGGGHFCNFEDIDFWFFANIIICDCTTYFAGIVIEHTRARARTQFA